MTKDQQTKLLIGSYCRAMDKHNNHSWACETALNDWAKYHLGQTMWASPVHGDSGERLRQAVKAYSKMVG